MTHRDETESPERDCKLWLRVCNADMDLSAVLRQLSDAELRVWVETAREMDIPRERKQAVAREFNRR